MNCELNEEDNKKFIYNNMKKLDKNDHMYIYNIIKNLEIYNITKYNIFFDLNDVPQKEFCMIYEYVKLSIDCLNRQKIIEQSKLENSINSNYIKMN